jgi:hypothetical protein
VATPNIKRKLRMFPIPKYLRIKKMINPKDAMRPCLEFAKTTEKVKKRARNNTAKRSGMTANWYGSIKKIIKETNPQTVTVIKRRGEKFLRFLICFFLCSLSI